MRLRQPGSERSQTAICAPKSVAKSFHRKKKKPIQRSKCLLKDDAWKSAFQLKQWDDQGCLYLFSLLCQHWWGTLSAGGTETFFYQSRVSPLSWHKLTYDLLHHILCRSLRQFQLGHTLTDRRKQRKQRHISQITSKVRAATSNLRARHGPEMTSTT